MTEIRALKSGGYGLFATKEFNVGDVIINESQPLIRLAPATDEQQAELMRYFVKKPAGASLKPAATATATATESKLPPSKEHHLLWDAIQVPSDIAAELHGKFRGMVQSALIYTHLEIADAEKEKLLALYYPSLTSIDPHQSEAEQSVVELSRLVLRYLEENVVSSSGRKTNDESSSDSSTTKLSTALTRDKETLQKIMLIWSCNAFEGGRVYDRTSRINHSCNPNAVVSKMDTDTQSNITPTQSRLGDRQSIQATCKIGVGEEITISYLGTFLYSGRATRQAILGKQKHFNCQCTRCLGPDKASSIPCLSCHPRPGGHKTLDEDVQYDDDGDVNYCVPKFLSANGDSNSCTPVYVCESCKATFDPLLLAPEHKSIFTISRSIIDKVAAFLQDRENQPKPGTSGDEDNDDDNSTVQSDLLEQRLSMASSVLGAKHWTTNILILLQLDALLRQIHTDLLLAQQPNNQGSVKEGGPDLETIAETVDLLQRVLTFVQGLDLLLQPGHLLSDTVIGVSRALVSLGDVKSQKYAAEWLEKIDNDSYISHFETEGMQKVVQTLKVAWMRTEQGGEGERPRASKKVKR